MKIPILDYNAIESMQARLRNIWDLKDIGEPLIQAWWVAENSRLKLPPPQRLNNAELDLERSLIEVERNTQALKEGFCNIPSLLPYFSPYTLASAFGCKMEETEAEGGMLVAHPLIHDPEEVRKIEKPDVRSQGLCKVVLERMAYFREKTEGRIPIRCTDTQSPIDVAISVWHYQDILTAFYTHPEEVHRFLKVITEANIEFLHAQKEVAGNALFAYGVLDVWHHRGVHLADDVAAVISPECYETFVKPYNEAMSKVFNGVIIHCCRSYRQNLNAIAGMQGFMGFDPSFLQGYHTYDEVRAALDGRGVYVGLYNPEVVKALRPKQEKIGMILLVTAETFEEAMKKARQARKEIAGMKP